MKPMSASERAAIGAVTRRARGTMGQDQAYLDEFLRQAKAPWDAGGLAEALLTNRRVTLNFHPDRLARNGRTILDNLLDGGSYFSQFSTGITNGSPTAFPGGNRDRWEKALFGGAYHDEPTDGCCRPKYGALNVMGFLDGASPRFGSCFFEMTPDSAGRCTFTYGDSHTGPAVTGTREAFDGVLRALVSDGLRGAGMFGERGMDAASLVEFLAAPGAAKQVLGRNLDDYIEAQIHGDIGLGDDMDCLYADESYRGTETGDQMMALGRRYDLALRWIPARRMAAADIPEAFRGPAAKALALRIVDFFEADDGLIDAELIGRASRHTVTHPRTWAQLGSGPELFQYIKQLWHVLARFG